MNKLKKSKKVKHIQELRKNKVTSKSKRFKSMDGLRINKVICKSKRGELEAVYAEIFKNIFNSNSTNIVTVIVKNLDQDKAKEAIKICPTGIRIIQDS